MADNLTNGCVHHWILGSPTEDIVPGRCKLCGAVRDYPATLEAISTTVILTDQRPALVSSRLSGVGLDARVAGAAPAW
jgi:hypothetical protein